MRLILTIALVLTNFICFSQKDKYDIIYSKETVGNNILNGKEITAECYRFPKRIEDLRCNDNGIAIYLRGLSSNGKWLDNDGDYIQYNLQEKSIRWSKKYSYTKMNWYTQVDSTIVFTSGFRSWLLDYNTGANKWKTKNNIHYIQPDINIGVAHGFSGTYGEPLIRGIDLETGKELWHEELGHNQGWEDLLILDDSTVLLISKGISLLNLRKGKVWQNTDIIKNQEPDSYTKQSFNFYKSLLTGNLSKYQKEYNTKSNENIVLVDSSSVFVFNTNEVASISLVNGSLIWKSSLSSLYNNLSIREDSRNFYIFQKCQKGAEVSSCRILRLDKLNGEIIFEKQIDCNVKDYSIVNSRLYLATDIKVCEYDLLSKKEVIIQDYSNEALGNIVSFILDKNIYQKQGATLESLSDEKSIVIFTEKKKAIILNLDLSVRKVLDEKDLFISKINSLNYELVNRNNDSFIVNQKGQIISEIDTKENILIRNDIVYSWSGNVLNIVNLKDLE